MVLDVARNHRPVDAEVMREAGRRLPDRGFESGDPQILNNIKRAPQWSAPATSPEIATNSGLTIHGDFFLGPPGETKESIRNTINFAKALNVDTIQASIAHAYPGTESTTSPPRTVFIINNGAMVDEGGHQLADINIPSIQALPKDYVSEMVTASTTRSYFLLRRRHTRRIAQQSHRGPRRSATLRRGQDCS